jgi:hypothetical protein
MQLIESRNGVAQGDVILLISGFGAATTLRGEVGLHVLELDAPREGGNRVVGRVRVMQSPLGDGQPSHGVLVDLLAHVAPASNVVRRYRLDSSPLVRDSRGWRTGRAQLVLDGDFDLVGAVAGH